MTLPTTSGALLLRYHEHLFPHPEVFATCDIVSGSGEFRRFRVMNDAVTFHFLSSPHSINICMFFHFSPPSRSALLMFDGNGYKDTESTTSYLCYSYVEFGWFFFGRLIHPFNSTNVDLLTPQRIS